MWADAGCDRSGWAPRRTARCNGTAGTLEAATSRPVCISRVWPAVPSTFRRASCSFPEARVASDDALLDVPGPAVAARAAGAAADRLQRDPERRGQRTVVAAVVLRRDAVPLELRVGHIGQYEAGHRGRYVRDLGLTQVLGGA